MKSRDPAHGRTADKGDTSDISVIYRCDDFAQLQKAPTTDRAAAHLGRPPDAPARYVLPQPSAVHFVIRRALRGGVTRSLAQDAHGKCLSSALLDMSTARPGGS